MGWNPFDDGDTEKDGVNAHQPKKQSLRERADKAPKGSLLKNLSNYRKSREDAMKLLD